MVVIVLQGTVSSHSSPLLALCLIPTVYVDNCKYRILSGLQVAVQTRGIYWYTYSDWEGAYILRVDTFPTHDV